MGLLGRLGLTRTLDVRSTSARQRGRGRGYGFRSRYSQPLAGIGLPEGVSGSAAVATREAAMAISGVTRGRNLICGTIANQPLRALKGSVLEPAQPQWLYTATDTTPWHRIAWTVDDLIFTGWSLWIVTRDGAGIVTEAERCPAEDWQFNSDGDPVLSGEADPLPADQVILFEGPFEGVLATGMGTIRRAGLLEIAWEQRAKSPIPLMELHDTSDVQRTDEEIDELLAEYAFYRSNPDGAVAFTPAFIQLISHGEGETDFFQDARNAVKLDIANHLNISASLLDASMNTASLTYQTAEDNLRQFDQIDVSLWSAAIASRLSMDDVVAKGVRVAFDKGQALASTPDPYGSSLES